MRGPGSKKCLLMSLGKTCTHLESNGKKLMQKDINVSIRNHMKADVLNQVLKLHYSQNDI